eukprot:scaffold13458_cov132-Skeletonema_dohrnii-CCMP3373.AAC.2
MMLLSVIVRCIRPIVRARQDVHFARSLCRTEPLSSWRLQRLNFCHGAEDYIIVVDRMCSADSCYQLIELHGDFLKAVPCSDAIFDFFEVGVMDGALFETGILIYLTKRHQAPTSSFLSHHFNQLKK